MSTETWDDEDTGEGSSFLAHLPAMISQRKWMLIVPAIVALAGGTAAAFLLPTVYRSTATMLVESSQFEADPTAEPTTEVIDQRIAKIKQQILSRPTLIEMIQQQGLYADRRSKEPLSTIVSDMRDAATITPVSAEIQGRGPRSSTIAFSLSFDYSDPIKAQSVAQELTERILDIDSTLNAEQAKTSVQFLTDQSTGLQKQIAELEAQINQIKSQNGIALSSVGATMIGSSSGGIDIQIAQLQRDNQQLNAQRDVTKGSAPRDPVVMNAEAQLAAARAVYSETHPDVVIAKQRLAEAKELANRNVEKQPVDTLDAQIAFNNSQIAKLTAMRSQEAARSSAVLGAQSRAPLVMEQVAQLQQKLEGLNTQYQQVSTKLMSAQANARVEDEQMGERLSVIDPPVVPDEPVSPNRPALIAGGLAAGIIAGLGLILLLELFYRPIRGGEALREITNEAPLVMIPVIETGEKLPWHKRLRAIRLWPFGKFRRAAEGAAA